MVDSVFSAFNLQLFSIGIILLLAVIGVLSSPPSPRPRKLHPEYVELAQAPSEPIIRPQRYEPEPGPSLSRSVESCIKRVLYVVANYPYEPYQFEKFDICDLAVLIELENGSWINWVWHEKGQHRPNSGYRLMMSALF